jgi:hypothetical protein
VGAFTDAASKTFPVSSANQIQFPSTNQLVALCQQLMNGSAFTSGLVGTGDPTTQGTGGALVSGSQTTIDNLCTLMGGAGTGTTPQALIGGATDVNTAINTNPMASGTIAMAPAAPSGNTALDAVNGVLAFAHTMFNIISACGCTSGLAPNNATRSKSSPPPKTPPTPSPTSLSPPASSPWARPAPAAPPATSPSTPSTE